MHNEKKRMFDAVFDRVERNEEKIDVDNTKELSIFLDWIDKFQRDNKNCAHIFGNITFNDFLRNTYQQMQNRHLDDANSMEKQDVKEKQELIKAYFKEYRSRKKLNKMSKTKISAHRNSVNYKHN